MPEKIIPFKREEALPESKSVEDIEGRKWRDNYNKEYRNWCEQKLASYYSEWQAVLNGKYNEIGQLVQHRVDVKVGTTEEKRKYVAVEIADMIKDTAGNFFYGGYGMYSNQDTLKNLEKIKEKLYLIAEKLGIRELVDQEMPYKEKKEEKIIPDFLQLEFEN